MNPIISFIIRHRCVQCVTLLHHLVIVLNTIDCPWKSFYRKLLMARSFSITIFKFWSMPSNGYKKPLLHTLTTIFSFSATGWQASWLTLNNTKLMQLNGWFNSSSSTIHPCSMAVLKLMHSCNSQSWHTLASLPHLINLIPLWHITTMMFCLHEGHLSTICMVFLKTLLQAQELLKVFIFPLYIQW